MKRATSLSLLLAALMIAASCGGDDGGALPSVPESAVPAEDPTVGTDALVTLADDNCLRADDLTLVFVDGQAEMTDVGTEQHLEVRWTGRGGSGNLASIPVGDAEPAQVLGHPVDPADWAVAPPDGCDGPYFLVTALDIRPR